MSIMLLIAGIALVLVGLFVLVPVAVNLPDSWVGALLAIALLTIGIVFIRRGVMNWRKGAD